MNKSSGIRRFEECGKILQDSWEEITKGVKDEYKYGHAGMMSCLKSRNHVLPEEPVSVVG